MRLSVMKKFKPDFYIPLKPFHAAVPPNLYVKIYHVFNQYAIPLILGNNKPELV
jgi:hypothetical protein